MPRSVHFILAAMLALFLTEAVPLYAASPPAAIKGQFIVLTDIHFDPFLSCQNHSPCPLIAKLQKAPVSEWTTLLAADHQTQIEYREDSPYSLLKSVLTASKQAAKEHQVNFVLILGDFLAHDFKRSYRQYTSDKTTSGYISFVNKTMEFLNNAITQTFPAINVYAVIGNNDTYQADYVSTPGGAFFQKITPLWSSLIKDSVTRNSMLKTFASAGYYAVNLPNQKNLRLIVLNTVLFSTKARGPGVKLAAAKELQWLHHELQFARDHHQKVLIAMHIPIGIDVYASLRTKLFSLVRFWNAEAAAQFQTDLAQFAYEIRGLFAGHIHSDWFQMLTYDKEEIPVIGTPAVSPIYGNNPGFKIYTYSLNDGQLENFQTYYYPFKDTREWGMEYDFNAIYQSHCHHCSVAKGMSNLQKSGMLTNYYHSFYSVGMNNKTFKANWAPYYWCAIRQVEVQDYQLCLKA